MRVYASCSSYTLGCLMGMSEASRLLTLAVSDLEHEQVLPAVHALRLLRELADLELRVDGGATQIAKTRSRHFDHALNSTCDVWVTVDDDVDTDLRTLALLLAAVTGDEPRVCFAPYIKRGEEGTALVKWPDVSVERAVASLLPVAQGRVRSALAGGFGLVAVNRAAMQLVARDAPTFWDADVLRSAAFLEVLTPDGHWLGEDFAFYERARKVATVEALVTGNVTHAGVALDLATLRQS